MEVSCNNFLLSGAELEPSGWGNFPSAEQSCNTPVSVTFAVRCCLHGSHSDPVRRNVSMVGFASPRWWGIFSILLAFIGHLFAFIWKVSVQLTHPFVDWTIWFLVNFFKELFVLFQWLGLSSYYLLPHPLFFCFLSWNMVPLSCHSDLV